MFVCVPLLPPSSRDHDYPLWDVHEIEHVLKNLVNVIHTFIAFRGLIIFAVIGDHQEIFVKFVV